MIGEINGIFERCYKAVENMGFAVVALEKPKLIEAHKRDNLIKVSCSARADKVNVFIQSDSVWITTIIDVFGSNQRNLDRLEKTIRTESITKENDGEAVIIKNTKIHVEAKDAEKAIGMEVNRPAQLSDVDVSLKVENVKNAAGFSTNQGLTGMMIFCSKCNQPIPIAYTGNACPQSVKCRNCGADNNVRKPN
jgi:hypothetical protein